MVVNPIPDARLEASVVMKAFHLGSGATAFEIEGKPDKALDPMELLQRGWPEEVVENYRRYRGRLLASEGVRSIGNSEVLRSKR
jgi:hypothetical protein